MMENMHKPRHETGDPSESISQEPSTGHTRRDLMRGGVKLVFVVPVISTFFAADAVAGTQVTCRSPGHTCTADSDCCGTDFCNVSDKCESL